MGCLGFDRVIFSLMTDHLHLDKSAGHGIVLNYPEDWMKHYAEKGYEHTDPVRHNMFASDGPFIWDCLPRTDKQALFFNQAEDAGLLDGIGIPLRGSRGAIAGVGAASSSGGVALNKDHVSYINLLCQQFYNVFIDIEKQNTHKELVQLSEREQEILKWCANGKTKWATGEILNISEHAVDYHVRKILKKFDANHITVASIKALHHGLIQL